MKLRIKYGLEGYGLYWYCLEMIAKEVQPRKLTFELEHDAEVIAFQTGVNARLVEDMMRYMVSLGLFQDQDGRILCLKMASRLEENVARSPQFREAKQHLAVVASNTSVPNRSFTCGSHVKNMSEENIIEDNIIEDNKLRKGNHEVITAPLKVSVPYQEIVNQYHDCLPELTQVRKLTETRKRQIKKLWANGSLADLGNWTNFFNYVKESDFLMGREKGRDGGRAFQADLEWMTKPANYVKILEGKYHG